MSPSLPSLPTAAATLGLLPAANSTIQLNQSDNMSSSGFGELLGEACSVLSPISADNLTGPLDGENLLAALPVLPQDGKLLPLLRQILDKVAGAGIDLREFVEHLATKLRTLGQDSAVRPEQQLAAALQQLLQEQPALKSELPADALDAITRSADAPPRPLVASAGLANQTPLVWQQTSETGVDLQQHCQQAVSRDNRPLLTIDTALSQAQQPIAAQDQRAIDTGALLAALKRLTSDNRSASADLLTRADSPVSGALLPTTASSAAVPSGPGMPTVTVAAAFSQAEWDQALGERIQWLASHKVQGAQVKLNPANLGPLEVRIQMQNDQATIQFTTHHAAVREALEAAVPRLKEMLEASGVQLVDVDVSGQQSFAGRQQAAHDGENPSWANSFEGGGESGQEIRVQTPLAAFTRRGRLDLFA